jgi:hypothetical protein
MLRNIGRTALAGLAFATSACATLVGGGTKQAVGISSDPSGASFAVKSSSGLQMAVGKTPQTISLPRKNEYQIEFSVPGYRTQSMALTKALNGWVFGNLIIGWIPGLIIDFATGSASKLEPSQVQIALERGAAGTSDANKVYGVVKQLDSRGRVMAEQRVEMVPSP